MGGHVNVIQDVSETTGFTLDRPYDHVNVTYDGLDRVTTAVYFLDAGETTILEQFTITYSADGHPIENGTEMKNHVFDIYRGRFIGSNLDSARLSRVPGRLCPFHVGSLSLPL